jgi:hypothetical protein
VTAGGDHDDQAMAPPSSEPARRVRGVLTAALLLVAAFACYVGIVAVRNGPPPGGDTAPLTEVATLVADGDLQAAASVQSLPNPPGYALLTAPFIVALPGTLGASVWCDPSGRSGPEHECGKANTLRGWEWSQGALGAASWLVLAIGGLALLRESRKATTGRQAMLLAFLILLPAASSAIVQLFHPQDIVSLGLALGALACTLRKKWVLAGVLFGAAVLSKQFALLLLLPALAAAPDARARLRLLSAAAVVFFAGFLPFLVADPSATFDNFTGVSAGGAVAGQTVVSLLGARGPVASAIARDAPVVFAGLVSLWAALRIRRVIERPEGLVALCLACAGSRLVFESVIFPYYLLAASVLVFELDLVSARVPSRSLAWCAAAAFFVALHPGNHVVAAFGTLILALSAVAIGLLDLWRSDRTDTVAATTR